jgi:hypothetical protein
LEAATLLSNYNTADNMQPKSPERLIGGLQFITAIESMDEWSCPRDPHSMRFFAGLGVEKTCRQTGRLLDTFKQGMRTVRSNNYIRHSVPSAE